MPVTSLVDGKTGISWPRTYQVLTCILIVSIFSTVGNSAPISPTDHLDWASVQSLLPSACTLSIQDDLHESVLVFLLVSYLGPLFLSLLILAHPLWSVLPKMFRMLGSHFGVLLCCLATPFVLCIWVWQEYHQLVKLHAIVVSCHFLC